MKIRKRGTTTRYTFDIGEMIEIRLPPTETAKPSLVIIAKVDEPSCWIEVRQGGTRVEFAGLDPSLSHFSTIESNFASAQIDTQKGIINRLLDHLKAHCPELLGEGKCLHIGGPEDVGVTGA